MSRDTLSHRLGGYGYMTAATATWGSIPVIVSRADTSAVVLVGLRMGIGAAALGVFLVLFGRRDLIPRQHRLTLVGLGAILAVHWVLFFRAIQLIGAVGVILTFVFPLIVAVLAPRILREPSEAHVLPLAAVGLAGTAVILASDGGGTGLLGGIYALVTAVLVAFLIMGARRVVADIPGPVIAFWQEGIGVLVLSPWIVVGASGQSIPWRWGVLLGVVHTAAASVLFFRSLARVPAQEAGVLMYVEPASAVVFVWAFDGLVPSVWDGVGGALVIGAGVALVVLSGRARLPVAQGAR